MEVQLSQQPNQLRWKLAKNGEFLVKSMYLDIINASVIPSSKHVWKVKEPLKIKVFMWFVHKQVILTKDNLAKYNWLGSKCSFRDSDESIRHLFLDCPLTKILWRSVHIAFNITPPNSINTLFGTWLDGIDVETTRHIRVGVCALLWAVWNCRNDLNFSRTTNIHFLQVVFRATTLIHMWSLLTQTEAREHLVTGSIRWETVAWVIFNRF